MEQIQYIVEGKTLGKKRWEEVEYISENLQECYDYIEKAKDGRAYRVKDLKTNLTSKTMYKEKEK